MRLQSSGVWRVWGRAAAQHRLLLAGLLTLVTAALTATAALRIDQHGVPIDFTPQAMFMDAGPEFELLHHIENTFGREDNTMVLMVHGDHTQPGALDAIRALHSRIAELKGVASVESIVTATVVESRSDQLHVIAPLDELPPAAALRRLASDALLGQTLVSQDLDTTAIRVRLEPSLERVAALEPVTAAVMSTATQAALPAGLALVPTGVPWVRVEVVDLMQKSQVTYLPIVALLFATVLTLLLRNPWLALAPLVTVLVADLWVICSLTALGQTFNVLSVLVPTLVVVIGVADGIHIVGRYREEVGSSADRAEALANTLAAMALPCFLTTFTTAAGFVSLLVAETSVIRAFGVQCAIAMLITFVAMMSILPVILAFIPNPRPAGTQHSSGSRLSGVLRWAHDAVAMKPKLLLGSTAAATLLAAAIGVQVQTNSGLLEMYRPGMDTWHAVSMAEDELAGVIPVMVHLSGESDSIVNPSVLESIDAIEHELRASDPVRWTVSPASVLRNLHQALTGKTDLPQQPDLIAQEMLIAEISGDRSIERVLSADRSEARILALMTDAGGRVYVPLRKRIQAFADQALNGTGVRATVTGDGFLAASGVHRLISDLLASLTLIFGIICATFALLLRDVRLALIAVIPNLVPLTFTLATLVLMGADLQTSNVVTFTVAVGLAVDDTIHFVVRYKQERDTGSGLDEALARTMRGAGHAIVVTSLLLIIGFGVLATDDLTSTRHFGILSSVTMAAAILGDLFLLPALIRLFGAHETRQTV